MHVTRRQIITAAMQIIEAEGPQAASMTRLAVELGCGLVPLYGLVPSRAALLDGIGVRLAAGAEPGLPAAGGWPEQLRAQARALRRAAGEYPRCAITVAGRGPDTEAARPAESALAVLRTAGFADPDAARILRAVAAFLAGSLLREVGIAPSLRRDGPVRDDTADRDADFELGLDLLLRGVESLAAARSPAGIAGSLPGEP